MLFDQNHIGHSRIPSQGSLGSLSEGLEMVCVGAGEGVTEGGSWLVLGPSPLSGQSSCHLSK